MKFLFDTNAIIPAEPTSTDDVEPSTPEVADLLGRLQRANFQVFIHPASVAELAGDRNRTRRELRAILVKKYALLESPPASHPLLDERLAHPEPGTHDAVDRQLLAAVAADAAEYLVSSDQALHRKAARVGLQDRVVSPADAIYVVGSLSPVRPPTPPHVTDGPAYQIQPDDPILASLRADYSGFDDWLKRCRREHRPAFLIRMPDDTLAGISILKAEPAGEFGFPEATLKICTFKISERYRGEKFGELLLKAIFQYATRNQFDQAYVTAFPKHDDVISLFEQFGFVTIDRRTEQGELVLAKRFRPTPEDRTAYPPLEFNRLFGPSSILAVGTHPVVVPIQRRYHDLLFPECVTQRPLFPDQPYPFGNAILKAYLCRSPMRNIDSGTPVLFYRSGGPRDLLCVGVVEGSMASSDPSAIARFVGKRTVYGYAEIEALCQSEVLALLFRHCGALDAPITLDEAIQKGALAGVPQSFVRVKEGGLAWLCDRIERLH